MKELKISQLAPGFRYLQTLALKSPLAHALNRETLPLRQTALDHRKKHNLQGKAPGTSFDNKFLVATI